MNSIEDTPRPLTRKQLATRAERAAERVFRRKQVYLGQQVVRCHRLAENLMRDILKEKDPKIRSVLIRDLLAVQQTEREIHLHPRQPGAQGPKSRRIVDLPPALEAKPLRMDPQRTEAAPKPAESLPIPV